MKQLGIKVVTVFALISVIMFSSCGSLSKSSSALNISTSSPAYTSGRSFGTSLAALYSSFKSTGKLDLTNANNLLNLAALATSASSIKGNAKNSTFYKEFAAGTISNSMNLVTTSNVDNIISTISGLDINSLVNNAKNNVTNANTTTVTNSLISLLNGLSK